VAESRSVSVSVRGGDVLSIAKLPRSHYTLFCPVGPSGSSLCGMTLACTKDKHMHTQTCFSI